MLLPHNHRKSTAFSLIELIVVIGIIVIIAGFAVPAAGTILRGSQLTQGAQAISDQISLARQQALTKNRAVEVRFYRFGDPEQPGEQPDKPESGKVRALQVFEVLESGVPVPLGKVQMLPSSVIINDDTLSTLVKKEDSESTEPDTQALPVKDPGPQDPELPRRVARRYKYVSFRFLPDGSTDLRPTGKWYLTLHALTDVVNGKTPPPNFFTLQVDPVSGTTKSYRPSAG